MKERISVCIQCMWSHQERKSIQAYICGALANLAYKNSANRVKIGEAGGIPVILAGMQTHAGDASVQRNGFGALGRLAEDEANRVKICEYRDLIRLEGIRIRLKELRLTLDGNTLDRYA